MPAVPVLTSCPKILWFNYRKEPTVYINGQPCSPRDPGDLHHNISVTGASVVRSLIEIFSSCIQPHIRDW